MDQAIDITRLLLNCGATVWLEGEMIYNGKVTPKPTHPIPYNRKLGIKIKSTGAQVLQFLRDIFPPHPPHTHTHTLNNQSRRIIELYNNFSKKSAYNYTPHMYFIFDG